MSRWLRVNFVARQERLSTQALAARAVVKCNVKCNAKSRKYNKHTKAALTGVVANRCPCVVRSSWGASGRPAASRASARGQAFRRMETVLEQAAVQNTRRSIGTHGGTRVSRRGEAFATDLQPLWTRRDARVPDACAPDACVEDTRRSSSRVIRDTPWPDTNKPGLHTGCT